MMKSGIDQDAIAGMFASATAKQGEALRQGVADATLKALQGRELTMANIKKVLGTVTAAASTGAARNAGSGVDVEAMLGNAVAGMDQALLQAVEANRKALEHFVGQGADLQDKQMKAAMANLETMEDTFFAAVTRAAQSAGGPLQAPWDSVLGAMKSKGSETGTQASQSVEQLMAQAQGALRESRNASAKAAKAMLDGYASLVSGVLIGMSQGLQQGSQGARDETDSRSGEPARARRK